MRARIVHEPSDICDGDHPELDTEMISAADQVLAHAEELSTHLVSEWRRAWEHFAADDYRTVRAVGSFGTWLEGMPNKRVPSSTVAILVKRLAEAERELAGQREQDSS